MHSRQKRLGTAEGLKVQLQSLEGVGQYFTGMEGAGAKHLWAKSSVVLERVRQQWVRSILSE